MSAETPVRSRPAAAAPELLVTSAPHVRVGRSTRALMLDVVLALGAPLAAAAILFGWRAPVLCAASLSGCFAAEAAVDRLRGRSLASLTDGSAVVTGLILALSLPPLLPLPMAFLGGAVAIGLGKMAFGGLGQNLFNPAMVGRAFLMACFPAAMTTWVQPWDLAVIGGADAVTGATPLAAAKFQQGAVPGLARLLAGDVGGSLGETSAAAVLLGGLYLVVRGTADWRQPAGMLGAAALVAAVAHAADPGRYAPVGVHLLSGALLFGAFFIATDYVGAPVTPRGRLVFGAGAGVLTMTIRLFGGYPEGVMFAILLMNALTPLIERWTIPDRLGAGGVAGT